MPVPNPADPGTDSVLLRALAAGPAPPRQYPIEFTGIGGVYRGGSSYIPVRPRPPMPRPASQDIATSTDFTAPPAIPTPAAFAAK